jgi:hypothetical protein
VEERLRAGGPGAARVRRELQAFRRTGPFHNAAAAKARADAWLESLGN